MIIRMDLGENGYDIVVERNALNKIGEYINLNRRVLIVTDDGVPKTYAETVAKQCKTAVVCSVKSGEESKSLETFGALLKSMLDNGFSRKDCVVAVGGGVVGDLAGFVSSAYMRGVDFYDIPTTLLSQIDSSIGGKTAINFGGVKNIVGAFYQPKKVVIDAQLLKTLEPRQLSNGLAEAVKMSLTSSEELFAIFENGNIEESIDEIIVRSLQIKKSVVEQDEKEAGLRKILNFGHTIGHGIEVTSDLIHGESVALGLIPLCDKSIQERVIKVLAKCNLIKKVDYDWEKITCAIAHDKKGDGDTIEVVTVDKVGTFKISPMKVNDLILLAKNSYKGLNL